MVSRLGRFLRKLRIDNNLILKDMADMLEVPSSMLSAVENGKKSAPLEWEDKIIKSYNLSEEDKEELHNSILESIKQIRIDIDISEAVNKLEKVKAYIEILKGNNKLYRSIGWEYMNRNKESIAEFHFGYAECCQATINDLEQILEEKK